MTYTVKTNLLIFLSITILVVRAKTSTTTESTFTEKQPLDFSLILPDASSNVTLLRMATPCVTPNGDEALCVEIQKCTKLIKQLSNLEARPFILDSRCGPADEDLTRPKVCCGKHNRKLQANPLPKICGYQNFSMRTRVFGGTEAELGEFPWMARLIHKSEDGYRTFGCSGFLIQSKYVLTAGHCLKSDQIDNLGPLYEVQLGEHNIETDKDCNERNTQCADRPQKIRILETIPYPNYDQYSTQHHYDIGLIYLKKGAKFTDYVRPICLVEKSVDAFEYWISGWGRTETQGISPVKMKLALPTFSHSKCNEKYALINIKILKNQICAGGVKRKDSCSGDSGGPLMVAQNGTHWYAAGVVSYGLSCGKEGWPGVYTNVTSYINWIKKEMLQRAVMDKKRSMGRKSLKNKM